MGILDHYPLDSRMRDLGFTDHRESHWHKSWWLGMPDIYLSLTIDKVSLEYDTLVEDIAFGQPYHYGRWQKGRIEADEIADRIDACLAELSRDGIQIDFNHAEYCYQPQEAN